ncbi:MAG: M1 family metallopeptidase [candidate division Zixibacteria bacterium]|nr:M1 family metallopeptidase [candidate division Zixibacteria bacterium]
MSARLQLILRSSIGTILLCMGGVLTAPAADTRDWDKATPAEFHQEMWKYKARALAARKGAMESAALGAVSQTDFDVRFHDIYIRVNDTTQVLYGRVLMVADATVDGLSQVQIDFYSNMTIDSIVAPSGTLAYSRAGNVVTITLGQTYNTGQQFRFNTFYHGHPVEGGFQAFAFDVNQWGKKVISSLSEPYFARTWWPCKDRPDDKADSFNIAIEVDTAFFCGSNGKLDSVVAASANSHTFHWSVRYPMVTYLFSVAISKYQVWYDKYVYNGGLDTMPIINAVYPEQYAYSLPRYGITPTAIQYLVESFGPYPFPREKYGHSNFEWGGGMEHQTMTSMMGYGTFGFSEPVVVHELGHQWWGDMITCKNWHHIWLNEGFASYCESQYYLKKSGWASYHSYMTSMEFALGGSIYIIDTTNVGIIFGSIVYDKGAWVLHMLRRIVGETGFANAMSAWYNSPYRYGSATTEQFRDVVEAATGVNVHDFMQDWIYGTYRPNYNYTYFQENAPGGGVNLYLVTKQIQTTNPQVFRMPVDFLLDYVSYPDDTVHLMVDQRKKFHKMHLPGALSNVVLDPANWILKAIKPSTKIPWDIYVVSVDSDLHVGQQYFTYTDTIGARGGTNNNNWSIVAGSLPPGLSINFKGIVTGRCTDTGTFAFSARVNQTGTSLSDTANLKIRIAPTGLVPGNVDMTEGVDISDLTYLIEYLYLGGPPPLAPATADYDNDCNMDISDLTALIGFLFFDGPPLTLGCAH